MRINNFILGLSSVLLTLIGLAWVLAIPDRLDLPLVVQQVIAVMIGLSIICVFLKMPYGKHAGLLELAIGALGAGVWFWSAWNFEEWTYTIAFAVPSMWISGAIAVVILIEALRKSVGLIMALVVCVMIAYGYVGDFLPGLMAAETLSFERTTLYLYADSNGIPGLVVKIIIELVIPFIIFGKVMEIAGGLQFFNDLALGWLGHKRGGPAKVAVAGSTLMGSMSGSIVANIMSTGVLTIPMMKRTGFKAHVAAAIETVASNGAQIIPPVMGATAFLIAEFLQVPYKEVVMAALLPAVFYYVILFFKIDAIAIKEKIDGLPREELPSCRETLKRGWVFLLPLATLVYLLFFVRANPGMAAIYASAVSLACFLLQRFCWERIRQALYLLRQASDDILPLVLIGAAAGAVVGIMSSTGFAFQLSMLLSNTAATYGLFAMLVTTGLVSIVLGMGMPTAAVYIVLASVVSPSLINLGVDPLAAHLFLFYYGLLSMITPPIAIGCIVAAQLAKTSMWTTSFVAMRLGVSAYLLPFLWVYNPALIMKGTALEIAIVCASLMAAVLVQRQAVLFTAASSSVTVSVRVLLNVAVLVVGGSTLWAGSESIVSLGLSALLLIGFAVGHVLARARPKLSIAV